jgi:hypothetical protein
MGYTADHRHDIKALNRALFVFAQQRSGYAPMTGFQEFVKKVNPKLHVKLVAPKIEYTVKFYGFNELKLTKAQMAEYIKSNDQFGLVTKWRNEGKLSIESGPMGRYDYENHPKYTLPGFDKMPDDVTATRDKLTKVSKAHAEDLQVIMDELAVESVSRSWCTDYESYLRQLKSYLRAPMPKPTVRHSVSVGLNFKFELPGADGITWDNRHEAEAKVVSDLESELAAATTIEESIKVLEKYKAIENPENRASRVQTVGLLRERV